MGGAGSGMVQEKVLAKVATRTRFFDLSVGTSLAGRDQAWRLILASLISLLHTCAQHAVHDLCSNPSWLWLHLPCNPTPIAEVKGEAR